MDKKEFKFLLKQGEELKLEFEENSKITRKKFAEKIGISEDEIKFNLDQLKIQKIKGVGSDKSGYWEVLK